MDEQRKAISPLPPRILYALVLLEVIGAALVIVFLFFPLSGYRNLGISLNGALLVPPLAFLIVSVILRKQIHTFVPRTGAVIMVLAAGAAVYMIYGLFMYVRTELRTAVLGEAWPAIGTGGLVGILLVWHVMQTSRELRPNVMQRTGLFITAICTAVAVGYGVYLTPPLVSTEYSVWKLAKLEVSMFVSRPGPSDEMRTLDGSGYSLADDHGKVVLMNFWATWCGPCIQELPHLQEMYEEMDRSRMSFVAVCVDRDTTNVRSFVDSLGYTFPVLWGKEDILFEYGIRFIPTNIIIDGDGIIRHAKEGFRGPDDIEEMKDMIKALSERTGS